MSEDNKVIPGSGLFTKDQILALATSIGRARGAFGFKTEEVCVLIEKAADALLNWQLWQGVLDGDWLVDIDENGEIVFLPVPEPKDPHEMIAEAANHAPECQCAICVYGADEWLRNFHPGEY